MSAELTPIAADGTVALCTVEQVKARMGLTTTEYDARIATLIDALLPTVKNRYGCEFMPRVTETRAFDSESHLVGLIDSDLHSVTSVVLDPNGTPITLASSDYLLRPRPLTGTSAMLLISDKVPFTSDFHHHFGFAQVAVTGTWGIWATVADVPVDIQDAAITCVLSWLDRPSANVAGIDVSGTRDGAPVIPNTWDIPAAAHRKFLPYFRPRDHQ